MDHTSRYKRIVDAGSPRGLVSPGQFEHEVRSRRTLAVVVPLVVALIFLLLYWTYHDLADAATR